MLQGLRPVNATVEIMGALQPGLPLLTAIPKDSYIAIIDLKDYFYTIPLHPEDCPRFAFSVPSVNFKEPMQRCQWRILPQKMANSHTLCQQFIDAALQKICKKYSNLYIIYYINDILIAGPEEFLVIQCLTVIREQLSAFGLIIAPEKMQLQYPYQYLGFQLYP